MNLKTWIRKQGVRQWMVAEAIGVTEWTFSRWLRRPERLEKAVVEKIQEAVVKIATKGERND